MMRNKDVLEEAELVPAMINEYWPDLIFLSSDINNRYGFMMAGADHSIKHGPAILRLEHGKIFVINQNRQMPKCTCSICLYPCEKTYHPMSSKCTCKYKPLAIIPVSTNDFLSFKPMIDECIAKWNHHHHGCTFTFCGHA